MKSIYYINEYKQIRYANIEIEIVFTLNSRHNKKSGVRGENVREGANKWYPYNT